MAVLDTPTDLFESRHLGSSPEELGEMLATLGMKSLDELALRVVPEKIRTRRPLALGAPLGERQLLEELRRMAGKNELFRSFLGMGYHDTVTPPVILRNIFENPGWYTQYTPYQAEIAQGRLEALLNFQTMVADLTGLPVANASLLDEATACAEAMTLCRAATPDSKNDFFVDAACHPQNRAVVETRALALGIRVHVGDPATFDFAKSSIFGALLQYPGTDGKVAELAPVIARVHGAGGLAVVAADLLALTLLRSPGELGADVAVGSAQRFGVPLGYGGPSAAFLSASDAHKRLVPGRIVGVSVDARGRRALRLSMQTREQHIRREKATSNICTAQVLLAIMASMYAVYHGPKGLRGIAERVHGLAELFRAGLRRMGFATGDHPIFDTVCVELAGAAAKAVVARGLEQRINVSAHTGRGVTVALDETSSREDVELLWKLFAPDAPKKVSLDAAALAASLDAAIPAAHARQTPYLTHPVFGSHHSEHEMLRYVRRLESFDVSLTRSMIPLGSCTMKLNATTEMLPVSWPELARLHPFVPVEQARGYAEIFAELERMLADVTGFAGVSLQPNAGSQGEYAGLLVIRAYHKQRGEAGRDVCLIPASAHGTNPASAVMAGMRVVVVACDAQGNIDVKDLEKRAAEHAANLAALMVTYPSTHGVYESAIRDICAAVHQHGGQVYMDGANLNAQVGLARPAEIGADVCHVNLHKTFAIPHGGGGPGMGPIAVAPHLVPFLPGHPVVEVGGREAIGAIAGAPWGSASILPISWAYMRLLGSEGARRATEVAILNANYMAKRLEKHYPVLYRGAGGLVAHEFIIDMRDLKKTSDVSVEDVAKRLMDFGYHAPTMSFPVANTMMIEPTESESKAELDRFCDAMIVIREEIDAIAKGEMDRANNPLKNAPHTAEAVTSSEWDRPYRREQGAFPARWVRDWKYWPPVARIDNAYGDRHFVCTCPPVESY